MIRRDFCWVGKFLNLVDSLKKQVCLCFVECFFIRLRQGFGMKQGTHYFGKGDGCLRRWVFANRFVNLWFDSQVGANCVQ